MNVFFVLDELTDSLDTIRVQAVCRAAKDAVMHPDKPRPIDEHFIGELTKQYVLLKTHFYICTDDALDSGQEQAGLWLSRPGSASEQRGVHTLTL